MFKKITLKNGFRIIASPIKGTRTVTFLVMVATGSRYEDKRTNGISHFLEHMIFKGTEKRPTTLDITETIDQIGGEYNAFTAKEYTGYYAKVASKYKKLAIDIISDIFLNSILDPREIEKERGVIIEELNMHLDTPTAYVGSLFEKLIYDDHPIGWLITGSKENIKMLTRDDLLEYFKTQYVASNTAVLITGDIDEEEAIEEIKEYFRDVREGKPKDKLPVEENQNGPKGVVHYKKTDQTHFCLGVRSCSLFSPDYFVLKVLSSILGGGMSSRLFMEIREKRGLAYYICCSSENYTDTGYLVVQAGVNTQKIEESIKVILDEFKKIREEKVSNKELNKAKEYLKGRLLLNLESSSALAFWLGQQEILRKEILTVDQVFERIDAVTSEDIQRVAQGIFQNSKLNIAIIGPFKDEERFNEVLVL